MEVKVDDTNVDKYRKDLFNSYVETFKRKMQMGPAETLSFLESLEKLKKDNLNNVQQKYNDVVKNSSKVIEDTTKAIKIAATIKLASTVTNSILSNFTPAGFVITYLQDNAMEFCSSLATAKNADIIALSNASSNTLPTAIISGINHAYEDGTKLGMDKLSRWATIKHLGNYSKATKKATKFLGNKGGISLFGQKIPGLNIVFTAIDIYDKADQFKKDIR
jgi:hypothetical protein